MDERMSISTWVDLVVRPSSGLLGTGEWTGRAGPAGWGLTHGEQRARMTFDPAISLLGLYSKELLAQIHKAIYYSVEVT